MNTYSPESGWNTVDTFDTGTDTSGSWGYRLSINYLGDMFLIWGTFSLYDNKLGIFAKRYDHIAGWGSTELIDQIETSGTGPICAPVLYMNHDNTLVLWSGSNEDTWYIYYKRFSTATGWQATQLLTSGARSGNDIFSFLPMPDVSFNSEGKAIAVWMTGDESTLNLWNSYFDPEHGFGPPEIIPTASSSFHGPSGEYAVSFDLKGNAIVVWEGWVDNSKSIWANRYTPTQGWGPAECIDTDGDNYSAYPTIGFNTYGTAIALWNKFEDGCWSVYSNSYWTERGWGTPVLLRRSEEGPIYSGGPELAFDSHGNAFSVWEQIFEGIHRIWASRYTYRNGWSEPELIDDPETMESAGPYIVVDSNGNAMAIWSQSDGSHSTVMARRYE